MDKHDPANNKRLRLICLPASPWSERARFALHAAGLLDRFQIVPYTPLTDERWLRGILKAPKSQRVSVPVIVFDDGSAIADSVEIGKWAAKYSNGKLALPADTAAFDRVVALSNKANEGIRYRSLGRAAASGGFDIEDFPAPLRLLPRFVIRAIYKHVNGFVRNKYKRDDLPDDKALAMSEEALRELSEVLKQNGGNHVVGDAFTLADIVATSAVGLVKVIPGGFSRMGPNMANDWIEKGLADKFPEICDWRDRVYREHRGEFKKEEGRAKQ